MDTTQFQLRLLTTWKIVLLLFSGLAAIIIVLFSGIIYNSNHHIVGTAGDIIWAILIFCGGCYALIQLGKRVCTYKVNIGITDKGISIKTNNQTEDISYHEILSYRYQAFNGGHELRIKLLNGEKRKFGSGGQFIATSETVEFINMAQTFELAIDKYQQQRGAFAAVLREKTFFEKPIATFFLVIYAGLVVVSIYMMVLKHKFIPSSLSSFGLFVSFAVAWYVARRKQRNG